MGQEFDYVRINLASPERIQHWSERKLENGQIVGKVTKPETINYRTLKPEMSGLFCERIFGPVNNWECHCGFYKHVRQPGLTCKVCGVDVTNSRVRRHRMGYIDLLTPVTHVWYLKGRPSYLAHILNMSVKNLENIIYSDDFKEEQISFLLVDDVFEKNIHEVGALPLYKQLKNINLKNEIEESRETMTWSRSDMKIKKAIRRIRILESFLSTNSKPEWMILTKLPVIPPGLRPMIQLDGGRFATSDLNDFYRLVITRNERLGKLQNVYAPDMIIQSEKRLIQEAIDALIDNGKRGQKIADTNRRPLKSLADSLKGKQGRFRQNLLGKRVDYSGRSVIIVGPGLDLNQCGLPYEMAIELFQPFIIRELIRQNLAVTIRMAKRFIQQNKPFIWELLQTILENHPIFLNRAPTLHRLGIQAFDPILVNGRAIKLHPLVCPAFNADFDGDQMAVHIPLSLEAQLETRFLMLAPNNFLSPSTGTPIIQPSQDMLLGCYYLTLNNYTDITKETYYFANMDEVITAYQHKKLDLHSSIWVRMDNSFKISDPGKKIRVINLEKNESLTIFENLQIKKQNSGEILVQYFKTTPGRILFNKIVQDAINL